MYRRVLLILSLILSIGLQLKPAYSLGAELSGSNQPVPQKPLLMTALEAVKGQLQAIDQDLAQAAKHLSTLDLKSNAARTVIRQLQARHADIVIDAATISPQGVMLLVEPDTYQSVEGTDISSQKQVQTIQRTGQPVMSSVFRTVEGVWAVDMEHPVVSKNGDYLGSVSVIFEPWVLIGKCVTPLVGGMPAEIWAMQSDGMIIYDEDPQEVGRMFFTDPVYRHFPELLQLGKRITTEPGGSGSYSYFKAGSDDLVEKDARWASITLHGTVWRLVSIHLASTVDKQ